MKQQKSGGVPRTVRVAEVVKETVAEVLALGGIKDPRVREAGLITVTRVEVSGDLRIATVGVIVHDADEEAAKKVIKGLASAAGVFRSALGSRIRARVTPELRFLIDEGLDAEARIEKLLSDDKAEHPPKDE